MTIRRTVLLAAYWFLTGLAAAAAVVLAPLPFTGPLAGYIGSLAAVAVLLIGTACQPHTTTPRKDQRS